MSEFLREVDHETECCVCGVQEWYIDPQHASDNGWTKVHEEYFCEEHRREAINYFNICIYLI